MADQTMYVELLIDASQANAGALAFEQAANRIQQSSERATASVDKLGQSIDRAGQKMSQAGQRSGAAALDQQTAATEKAAAAMRQLAEAHETTIRRMQTGAFNVFDQTATLGGLAQLKNQLERGGAGAVSPLIVGAPERAGLNAAAPVIAAEAIAPLTEEVFSAIHPSGALTRAARFVRQAEVSDTSAGSDIAKIHASESVAAGVALPIAQAAGSIAGASPTTDALLAASMERVAAANDRAARATEAAAAKAIPATVTPLEERAAYGATTALGEGDFNSPASLRAAASQVERQRAIEERAAYGFTTAAGITSPSQSALSSLARVAPTGGETIADRAAAYRAALPPPHVKASQIDAGAFLQSRKPVNDVDVAAFNNEREAVNKAREGTDSLWSSLKNFFSGSKAGSGDLHAASAATEELATASEHAAGAGGRMREAFVIMREIFRGDFTRLVGSTTIELQRFGLLGYIFNPITLGVTAAVGALGYLAYKASEIDANLRSFGTTVKVMGDGSLTSAADLEKFTEELKHTGVAGADAKKTIDEISRSGFVRPGQSTADFASLARDISQYQGAGAKGTPAAAEDLVKAFSGDADGAIKFAESLHALSGPQIAAIHDLDQHAKSGEAFQKIYAAIRATIPPFIGDLSDLQKAFLGITTEWDKFTTELAKGDFPSLALSAIKGLLDELKADIRTIEDVAHVISGIKATITGAATTPGGISRDQIAPQYGPGSGNIEPYASATLPPRPLTGGAEVKQADFLNYAGTIGFTPSQGAALAGQARQESGFNTGAGLQPGAPSDAGKGLFQWDNNRWGQLVAWAQLNGLDPMDYRTQLQFAKKEIPTRSPAFLSASTLSEQNTILTKQFESPKDQSDAAISKRLGYAEQALGTSTTPFRPTEAQTAAYDLQNQKLKEQLGISSQIAGVDREAVEARIRLQQEATKTVQFGDRAKYVDEGMIGFFKNRQELFESQHRLNDIEISDTDKIAAGYQKSAVEGLRAETLVQAQQQIRTQGGAPEEVTTAQRDIINQRTAAAISSSRQQSILAEPAIAGAEALARASQISRAEEEKTRVATEAAVQTQNVLNLALLSNSDAYKKDAAAADENARSQIRRRDAAAQGLEAGHQIQANQDQSRVLALEVGLQGEGSNAIRTQADLLRARQEIEQRYTALTQDERDAIFASTAGVIQQNAALTQAQEAAARIEEAFRSLTSTIDGDLTNSIRNALIRTPAEAGEHLKHYWDDFRAGLRQVAGEILSTFAQLAFVKPLTGSIAGALGFGQTAQQLGTFGGLFQGGGGAAPGTPGTPAPAGASTFSGTQLALNVAGLSSGSSVFGANVPGSTVFQSGNVVTVAGGAPAVSGTGEAVQSATGNAGLSADQLQAILSAQPTPVGAGASNTPLIESFLGTITAAAGAQPAASAASTTPASAGTTVFQPIALAEAPATPASLAPQLALPEAAALATGVASPSTPSTPAAATPGLITPGNIGGTVAAVSGLSSLLSQPGLLPSWLSGVGGAGGLFGAGGITGAINSVSLGGLFATQIPAGEAISQGLGPLAANAAGNVTVPGSLFGSTATLGSALTGVAAGFGAGSLLNSVLGGNQLTGNIGAGAGALLGTLVGSFVPVIGTLLGGIVGGAAGGGLGGLLGAPPSGQSAGVFVGAGGAQTFEDVGGSAANIQSSNQVAAQISSFEQALGQLTNAAGQPIGTLNTGGVAVSSNNTSGITVTGGNIAGGSFDQNAAEAVTETELQIIASLNNVSGSLQTVLQHLTDPSQLQAAVQFADVYDKLNVTSQELTASLTGNTNQIGPFSQALTQINTTFSQLTAQATQFGVSTAPITAALDTVTQTLKTDFGVNIAEALSTAIDGGNDFIASLIKIHQQYIQNINDAQALATGVPTGTTPAAAAGSSSTPPGQILVGEKGPEWMLPRGGGANDWVQVGKSGPELIDQPGGAVILPNPLTPESAFMGGVGIGGVDTMRMFAEGTIGAGDVAGQLPGIGSYISQQAGGPSLLEAAGGAVGLSADTLSAIGTALPIAGPIIGGLLGAATGHPVQGAIGAASSLIGFAVGGPLGGIIGGLVGLIGNLFGPPPSNKASGDLVDLASGAITDFQSAGDAKADQVVQGISSGISAETLLLQQATGGSISGAVSVQDGARDGIKTSYSGPAGNIDAKWSSADEAIGQWALAIAHNLTGIDPGLQAALSAVTDPTQLIPVIDAYVAAQTPAAAATPAAAQPAAPPPPPQLYSITQSSGPSYVGSLTTADVSWWQNAGATVTPYTGAAATARQGATLYQINQSAGPSYVGDLTPADAAYWQTAGATLTPYGELPAPLPNASLYFITQPGGPSYLGDLTAPNLAWWQNTDATVVPSDGSTLPTPRQGASLYEITQGSGPWYVGDLTPADAQWWETQGATVTPFAATAQTVVSSANAPGFAAGTTSTPAGWILVGEQGPEWMLQPGGATVLPNGVQPTDVVSPVGRSFATGTDATSAAATDAAAATAAVTAAAPDITAAIATAIAGTEVAQAGPVLAGLGIDQLTTVIQNLAAVAPEIATMAQNLVSSGNALPDILTQGIQALTDPLDIAIEKEKAAGQERIAIATQTGQDLVEVEQLNSANIINAVVSNLSNQTALTALQYPGNTRALETIQAAPVLAGLSGQQLAALVGDIGNVAPDLAALAQQLITSGTALPDVITQALEGIVNPLELAIQQQAAQAEARNQVQAATGQNPVTVAALNTASITQAIVQSLGNPQALLALAAHGSAAGLTGLEAGPAIAGLGLDQLTALISAIGTAAPNLTDMINALINSGNALPDALTQATQAIVESGVLAVEKAQAFAFEQVQAAAPAGQNVAEAQTLGAAEVAQATAQATGTQIPLGPLPDWVGQLEEAVTAPLQLAIQKEQAAGIQRVQIAETTGANLVAVQQENADAIAQIWYQATQQLTSLKNDITTGSLSGLTAANQVTGSIEQFNTVLGLVQGGNTNFINELASTGQAAIQAAQQAYGNGPQTASVREQVYQAISPLLVSSTGYPNSSLEAVLSGNTTGSTATGTTTDLQNNTTALQDLTTAITAALPSIATAAAAPSGSSAATTATAGTSALAAATTATAATAASGPTPGGLAATLNAPANAPLYNITQPGGGPSYVGDLTQSNLAWWQQAGANVTPYTGTLPTPGPGESLYQITQQGGGPNYIGSLNYANLAWWQQTGATVTPYTAPAATSTPAAITTAAATSAAANAASAGITTNPVTGQSFTGTGITAITPNFPQFPSASTLSNALADAIAGSATSADWTAINQAVQAGILNPANQPGYALVIQQAQQWAAGQAVNPSDGLSQALSDALNGTPTLLEWELINQAVNAGLLSPESQPQYASVIREAQVIANAQAVSLSQIPNTQTAAQTVISGLPAFAAGSASTPPGYIMVGEQGPEWYLPANDNRWTEVGVHGPEILNQSGGAQIIPFPKAPIPGFADGTASFYMPPSSSGGSSDTAVAALRASLDGMSKALVAEIAAVRKQVWAAQMTEDQNAKTQHALTRETNQAVGPNISAPVRRAVG